MPRTPRGKDKPHEAKPFTVRFNCGWQVRQGKQWRRAREVSILTPTIAQPNGELHGDGVVTEHGDIIAITS